jgi:dTDP-4-amino-4,6-dideoxygalactose transaminase
MRTEQLAIEGGPPVRAGSAVPLMKVCWDEDEQNAVQRVFESGYFCSVYEKAPEVKGLEQEFAQCVGARYAVAFNSGTTAQHAVLVALGIGPGDEVIVPTLTFMSTAYSVLIAGAVPVFVDVQSDTITMDPRDAEAKITARTRAIVPVHWLGQPADMDAIITLAAFHDLAIVEDCAHGPGITLHGQEVGGFGQMAIWSLQQSKMLTAAGEGGLATTNDKVLATRLRQICDHGKSKEEAEAADFVAPYRITALGNNYRLSEIQAAFARAQLAKLPGFQARRRAAYASLRHRLGDIPGLRFPALPEGASRSGYVFPVLFPGDQFSASIQRISAALHAEGVESYPIAVDELCHIHPLFAKEEGRATALAYRIRGDAPVPACGWGTLPVAEKIAAELLLLPMHPDLSDKDLEDVAAAVHKVAHVYHRGNSG